jgi:hypothetical protein
MMGMRGSNWAGFLIMVIFLIVHEPIFLFVWTDAIFFGLFWLRHTSPSQLC